MKKLISLTLALVLCASLLAASMQAACPAPASTVTGEPDSVNGLPAGNNRETEE